LISDHLHKLCHEEGFSVAAPSLDLVAQEADGSIRDALSLLDRILSSANTPKIEHQTFLDGLGILDQQILHDTATAIFEHNGARLIEMIEQIADSGIDLKKFYSDLIVHFRNLNVVKICGKDSPAANITDAEKEMFFQATSQLSSDFINTILHILLDEESLIKYSSHTRTAIEMVLLKLLQINPGAQIDHIINRLDMLAKRLSSSLSSSRDPFEPVQPFAETDSSMSGNTTPITAVRESVPATGYHAGQDPSIKQTKTPEKKTWQGFLNKIQQTLPFMFALLSKGITKENGSSEIIVELKNCSSFDKKRLKTKQQALQTICKEFLGQQLTINIVSENNPLPQHHTTKNNIKDRQAAFNHPLVVEAQKIFDGEIINP
jgi:DNA polymerase-3 subunit gamma/tau